MVRDQVLVLEPFLIKVPLSIDNNPDDHLEIFGLYDNPGAYNIFIRSAVFSIGMDLVPSNKLTIKDSIWSSVAPNFLM